MEFCQCGVLSCGVLSVWGFCPVGFCPGFAPIILSSLTKYFNLSLKTGIVPQDWKLARVTLLYKGSGSKSEMGIFRPISVISFIPKIIEHHVKE